MQFRDQDKDEYVERIAVRSLVQQALKQRALYGKIVRADLPVLTAGQSHSNYFEFAAGAKDCFVEFERDGEATQATPVQVRSSIFMYFSNSDLKGGNPNRYTYTGGVSIVPRNLNGHAINQAPGFQVKGGLSNVTVFGAEDHETSLVFVGVFSQGNIEIKRSSSLLNPRRLYVPAGVSVLLEARSTVVTGQTEANGVRMITNPSVVEGDI